MRLARFLLPLGALILVGIVASRLSQGPLQQIETVPAKDDRTTPGQIELLKAQYEGVDDQGQPYTLIADRASRAMGTDDTVLLEGVKADITLENGAWLAVHAKAGSYAATAGRLELIDGVSLFHDSGYEMTMESASIDLKTRDARAKGPVHAQGPALQIDAAGMTVSRAGEFIVFGGPAKLTLYRLGDQG